MELKTLALSQRVAGYKEKLKGLLSHGNFVLKGLGDSLGVEEVLSQSNLNGTQTGHKAMSQKG